MVFVCECRGDGVGSRAAVANDGVAGRRFVMGGQPNEPA